MQADGEQRYRRILERPELRIPTEVQELRLLQAKILKDVSSPSPTVHISQVKQLLKKTEELLQQVTSQQPFTAFSNFSDLGIETAIQSCSILTLLMSFHVCMSSCDSCSQHIKSLCGVQIQLLDTIKMSVMGKLDPKQAENLQNDKVINLDIINRLMKRVKVSMFLVFIGTTFF
jgi:hypothetical protein